MVPFWLLVEVLITLFSIQVNGVQLYDRSQMTKYLQPYSMFIYVNYILFKGSALRNSNNSYLEEPTRDATQWFGSPRDPDPDVWPPPTPADHRFVFSIKQMIYFLKLLILLDDPFNYCPLPFVQCR